MLAPGHRPGVECLSYDGVATLLAGGYDKSVVGWNLHAGAPVGPPGNASRMRTDSHVQARQPLLTVPPQRQTHPCSCWKGTTVPSSTSPACSQATARCHSIPTGSSSCGTPRCAFGPPGNAFRMWTVAHIQACQPLSFDIKVRLWPAWKCPSTPRWPHIQAHHPSLW